MKNTAWIAAALALAACSPIRSLTTKAPPTEQEMALAREREITRRYTVCMNTQLGPLGKFATIESRRRAAEECRKLVAPDPAQPPAT